MRGGGEGRGDAVLRAHLGAGAKGEEEDLVALRTAWCQRSNRFSPPSPPLPPPFWHSCCSQVRKKSAKFRGQKVRKFVQKRMSDDGGGGGGDDGPDFGDFGPDEVQLPSLAEVIASRTKLFGTSLAPLWNHHHHHHPFYFESNLSEWRLRGVLARGHGHGGRRRRRRRRRQQRQEEVGAPPLPPPREEEEGRRRRKHQLVRVGCSNVVKRKKKKKPLKTSYFFI